MRTMCTGAILLLIPIAAASNSFGQSLAAQDFVLEGPKSSETLCHAIAFNGAQNLKLYLPSQPKRIDSYNEWLKETPKDNLWDPVESEKVKAFCPDTSGCTTQTNWFFTQHPDARIRKVAVFQAARTSVLRLGSKKPLRDWTDIETLVQDLQDQTQPYSTAAKDLVRRVTGVMLAKRASFRNSASATLCPATLSNNSCSKAVRRLALYSAPRVIKGDEVSPDLFTQSMSLALPYEVRDLLTDHRYAQALAYSNQRALKRVEAWETQLKGGAEKFLDFEHPYLLEDLQSGVEKAFACQAGDCQEYVENLAGFYGLRGASFLAFISFFTDEQIPFFVQYGIFASLASYQDVLLFDYAQGRSSYTLPEAVAGDCLSPNPYHFWMARHLAVVAHARLGLTKKESARAVLLLSAAYEYSKDVEFTGITSKDIGDPLSHFYSQLRLSFAQNARGVSNAFEADTSLSSLSQALARVTLKSATTTRDQDVKVQNAVSVDQTIERRRKNKYKKNGSLVSKFKKLVGFRGWYNRTGAEQIFDEVESLIQ